MDYIGVLKSSLEQFFTEGQGRILSEDDRQEIERITEEMVRARVREGSRKYILDKLFEENSEEMYTEIGHIKQMYIIKLMLDRLTDSEVRVTGYNGLPHEQNFFNFLVREFTELFDDMSDSDRDLCYLISFLYCFVSQHKIGLSYSVPYDMILDMIRVHSNIEESSRHVAIYKDLCMGINQRIYMKKLKNLFQEIGIPFTIDNLVIVYSLPDNVFSCSRPVVLIWQYAKMIDVNGDIEEARTYIRENLDKIFRWLNEYYTFQFDLQEQELREQESGRKRSRDEMDEVDYRDIKLMHAERMHEVEHEFYPMIEQYNKLITERDEIKARIQSLA